MAMDLAGLASFEVTETWNQFLFTHLVREQPKGFAKISLQQILDTDKQLFILASHQTMGRLSSSPDQKKPLDEAFERLKDSNEVLQFLTPLPAQRSHDAPVAGNNNGRPTKVPKIDKGGKGGNKGGHSSSSGPSKPQLPDGCVTHDDEKRPLCFAYQSGESASSKDQQENGALVAITSATNVDASDRSLITCVTTQTEARIHVHRRYRIQIHPYLWKFLRDEGPYQKR